MSAGRPADARAAFRRAVGADPGFYDAWLQLAGLELRSGDDAAGLADATRAASLPQARDGRAAALLERARGSR